MAELPRIDNRVPNPSFETNLTGWVSDPVGSITFITTSVTPPNPWSGQSFARTTLTAAQPGMSILTPNSAVDAMRVIVAEGEPFSAGIRMRPRVAGLEGLVTVTWVNAAGAAISTVVGSDVVLTLDAWLRVAIEALEVPALAVAAHIRFTARTISGGNMGIGDAVEWDGAHASPTDELPAYVDGGLGTYHHWLGTAHASASYRETLAARQTAGRRGTTHVSARLYLSDKTGAILDDITPEGVSGRVTMNIHNPIKHSLVLAGRGMTEIEPFTSYVSPYLLLDGVEYPMGVYICTPAKLSHKQAYSLYSLEGRGLTWILANSYPSAPHTALIGTNPVTNVRAILDAHGLRHAIPSATVTLPVTITWDIDKSWLDIINEQLNGAAYYTLWDDLNGYLKSQPYFELATATPALQLYSGEGGIVTGAIEQEGVYDTLANQIIVMREASGSTPAIRVIRTNNDLSSPVSVPNLGRTLPRIIKDSNLISVTEARAVAKREIEVGTSFTNKLKVLTLPQPVREVHEVHDLAIYNALGQPLGFGLWWCDSWEIGFTAKEAVQAHHVKRLEAFGWDEVYT